MQSFIEYLHINANNDQNNARISLMKHDNSQINYDSVLHHNKYVMLYFAAHWAPSCQRFTPFLADFYKLYRNVLSFEVIFVSLDRTERHMLEFYNGIKSNYVRRDRAAKRQSYIYVDKVNNTDNVHTNDAMPANPLTTTSIIKAIQ